MLEALFASLLKSSSPTILDTLELAERREECALARKLNADMSWLGATAAQVLGPQLTISGPTLAFVAGFIGDRVKVWGSWPEMKDAIEANAQAMQGAGVKEVERLLREAIVLQLVN